MLQNINSYGLSHLCDFSIFESTAVGTQEKTFSYPFLDIYFKYIDIIHTHQIYTLDAEVYSRGNKYYKTSFNNLFEYHIFNEQFGYKD